MKKRVAGGCDPLPQSVVVGGQLVTRTVTVLLVERLTFSFAGT